jgi:hypothetical protein
MRPTVSVWCGQCDLTVVAWTRSWVRKAAVFILGEVGQDDSDAVCQAIAERLASDESVYVRSVAAGALGCLGRRAAGRLRRHSQAGEAQRVLWSCVECLLESLSREPNRESPERVQKRSIKFVRPTVCHAACTWRPHVLPTCTAHALDACSDAKRAAHQDEADVCEGMGITFDLPRFSPVRSAVRENCLWSLVILCTHIFRAGPARLVEEGSSAQPLVLELAEALASVASHDPNVFCVGFAMDALRRLARGASDDGARRFEEGTAAVVATTVRARVKQLAADAMHQAPMRSWESLCRSGGMESAHVAALVPEDQINLTACYVNKSCQL